MLTTIVFTREQIRNCNEDYCNGAIFELPGVHTREKASPSLRFSIPERGEETWLIF